MLDETQVVESLPLEPSTGATYSFSRIPREDVVYGTHGFHKYPAKFIPQFPKWALSYDPSTPRNVVLDPFCGSGTTLIEAGLVGAHAIGSDISPVSTLISRAKASVSTDTWDVGAFVEEVLSRAGKQDASIRAKLEAAKGKSVLGLHYTWSNWFEPHQLSKLLSLRNAIRTSTGPSEHKTFSLAVLSSIVKACSYLDENQIKVRYKAGKRLADPVTSFASAYSAGVTAQHELGKVYEETGARFDVYDSCASALPLAAETVDRVITSPPYINAVDYTMAHKYNMFVLGLVEPEEFKDHCRAYIGVTERAVRAADLKVFPSGPSGSSQDYIGRLWTMDTATSRNRAFVVAQYFNGMLASFREAYRVLRGGGLCFLVVGETNRICGITIPTANILRELAIQAGFGVELEFYHLLANRSAMRLRRSSTGGTINREVVYVLRKI